MGAVDPKVIIRMGSHAEKEYLHKTMRMVDGLIIGANLVEATPGATASLLVKFGGKRLALPFYLDPMTYAFGSYVDPNSGKVRKDLDWIKSDQKQRGSKRLVRAFKRSYKKLAEALGDPFANAIERGASIEPSDFQDDRRRRDACDQVVRYQLDRARREFAQDPDFAYIADDLPTPAAVFAPYFYIEPSAWKLWTDLTIQLAGSTASLGLDSETHIVLCADVEFLVHSGFLELIKKELPATGARAVWLWFSRFNERSAESQALRSFRTLVESLAGAGLKVFNMHGGYFSLALSKVGLTGTSHGVGYGEQKDVMPVIGQSTPTVRYYLPGICAKVSVVAVERTFDELGVNTPDDFYCQVCDCIVCKGVVRKSVDEFRAFGEMHYSTPQSERKAQTPAAAKRCRFHFLLNRIRERDWLKSASILDVTNALSAGNKRWCRYPSLASECTHLPRWLASLK